MTSAIDSNTLGQDPHDAIASPKPISWPPQSSALVQYDLGTDHIPGTQSMLTEHDSVVMGPIDSDSTCH
ncbi:hypothetical protein STEG23_006287 [Scotinomys teguina]